MSKTFKRRLAAAERELKPKEKSFRIIRVIGGLPGPVRYAGFGGLNWQRAINEPLDSFEGRVIAEAKTAGLSSVVIGGLPGPGANPEGFDFEEFEARWMEIDEQNN